MTGVDEIGRARIIARMDRVDSMSPDVRAIVHEHGLTIVDAFLQCGVTKAKHMRHLINTIRAGSYEIGNRSELPGRKLS